MGRVTLYVDVDTITKNCSGNGLSVLSQMNTTNPVSLCTREWKTESNSLYVPVPIPSQNFTTLSIEMAMECSLPYSQEVG